MSKSVNSTEVRRNVQALLAAARSAVDGYERHIARSIAQVKALIREGERWADEGGEAHPTAQRYAKLARAYEQPCRCSVSGRCGVCRSLRTLGREFSTAIELEVAALTAFEWMAGLAQPDLEDALDDLNEALRRVTNDSSAARSIMNAAKAGVAKSTGCRLVA